MIELALIAWAITWCVKNAISDVRYAALGKTPPRYQYGLHKYAASFAADFLEAKTEKRRELAAKRSREAKAAAKAAPAPAVEPVEVPAPAPAPAPAAEVPAPAEAPAAVALNRPISDTGSAAVSHHDNAEPTPVPAPESNLIFEFEYEDEQEVEQDEPAHSARIIPMFAVKKEVPPMAITAAPVAEITGLQSAIAYADAVADAHASHSSGGGEAYIGSLQAAEVSGRAIQMVAEAQEASQIAADSWRAAAVELAKQNIVKEAYDSVPDAGSKVFVQGE